MFKQLMILFFFVFSLEYGMFYQIFVEVTRSLFYFWLACIPFLFSDRLYHFFSNHNMPTQRQVPIRRYQHGDRVEVRDKGNNNWFAAKITGYYKPTPGTFKYVIAWDWSRNHNFDNAIVFEDRIWPRAVLAGVPRACRPPDRYGFEVKREEDGGGDAGVAGVREEGGGGAGVAGSAEEAGGGAGVVGIAKEAGGGAGVAGDTGEIAVGAGVAGGGEEGGEGAGPEEGGAGAGEGGTGAGEGGAAMYNNFFGDWSDFTDSSDDNNIEVV